MQIDQLSSVVINPLTTSTTLAIHCTAQSKLTSAIIAKNVRQPVHRQQDTVAAADLKFKIIDSMIQYNCYC
jgi:hypothetical protein